LQKYQGTGCEKIASLRWHDPDQVRRSKIDNLPLSPAHRTPVFKTSVTKKRSSLDEQRVGSHSMPAYQVFEHHHDDSDEVTTRTSIRRSDVRYCADPAAVAAGTSIRHPDATS
jgi:hypothetical protein